jgi:hypothetical protein
VYVPQIAELSALPFQGLLPLGKPIRSALRNKPSGSSLEKKKDEIKPRLYVRMF